MARGIVFRAGWIVVDDVRLCVGNRHLAGGIERFRAGIELFERFCSRRTDLRHVPGGIDLPRHAIGSVRHGPDRTMSRRIVVLERAVVAVGVEVQGQRVAALPGIRILLQETRCDRIVHARIQVVHARLGIVLVAREKYVVVRVAGLFDHVAEGVVVVGRGDPSVERYK